MIPSFISLLVLLSVVTARDQIDLSSCQQDGTQAPMVCYFPSSCIRTGSTQLILADFPTLNSLASCEAVVSFKQFTDRKWLVIMQVMYAEKRKEIEVQYGSASNLLFGCKSDENGAVTVDTGSLTKVIYKTAVSGKWMLCKFTVEGDLQRMLDASGVPFKLVLPQYPSRNCEEQANNVWFRVNSKQGCDGSLLKFHEDPLAEDRTSLRPLVEYDRVRCDPGATLMAVQSGKPVEANVVCSGGSYQVTARQPTSPPLDLTSKFACSVKTCTRCEDVAALGGGTNPDFASAVGDSCTTLTCPGDRIQVPGTKPIVAKPACKEFGVGDFRWTITHAGNPVAFTEAACQASVKCNDVNPLHVIPGDTASKINPDHSKIACSIDYQLAARASSASPWSAIDSVTCNDQTGVWTKDLPNSKEKLLPTEEIKCMNEEEATAAFSGGQGGGTTGNSTKAPAPSEGNLVGVGIAIAFVAIAVILLIIFFAYYTIRRRRAEKSGDAVGEVDAKPPTPPASTDARASDKQFGTESTKMNVKEIPTAKQLEDNVSITAHPMPPTGPPSNGPSDKNGASDKSTPPAPPADVELSKKKVEALLDQSVPSMSE